MSSFNLFQISKENMADAGLPVSLLTENYAWVDERLEDMYYRYALTVENFDEFKEAGLLKDTWAGVEVLLEGLNEPLLKETSVLDQELLEEDTEILEQWNNYPMTIDELIEDGPPLSLLDLE